MTRQFGRCHKPAPYWMSEVLAFEKVYMTITIYFSDLIPETQAELLEAANISDPSEANWDVFPLAEIEVEPDKD